jgi:endonuclease III
MAVRKSPSTAATKATAARSGGKRRQPGAASNTGTTRTAPIRRMPASDIGEFFARLRELDPQPRTELEYSSPYELLVAVTLSAQATDAGVNKATRRLFPEASTPQQIAALGVDGLKPYIASIGLFNTKAANVVAAARMLVENHGGEVPRDRNALEGLPGVGRKTANVVLNTAFGEPTMAVDTHIFRVANRTGLAPGRNVREVEDALLKRVPREFLHDAHHWLILHGRYTCKARRPECPRCPVRDLCRYPDKTPGEPE